MNRRILLTCAMARHAASPLRRLRDAGFELVEGYHLGSAVSEEVLTAALSGMWGTIAGSERYTRRVLESAPDLRIIARCGVGYDAIDMAAADDRGVAVVITPEANFESVADFALTLMLACLRRLPIAQQTVLSGGWRLDSLASDLYGATVGIVGLGRIGQAVARRLRGFNCTILGVETNPNLAVCRELGIELTTLNDVLPRVDVLTLHVPRLPETVGLIGAAQLARLKPSAVLVNTSRGGIVDEQALYDALTSGSLAGAALDVFEYEPLPIDHALRACPNVILTGHVSSFTRLAAQRTMEAVADALLAFSAGRMPDGLVNPSVWRG